MDPVLDPTMMMMKHEDWYVHWENYFCVRATEILGEEPYYLLVVHPQNLQSGLFGMCF